VVGELVRCDVTVSVDTVRAEVAAPATDLGAVLVND
jgi:dihydropteroate synthase